MSTIDPESLSKDKLKAELRKSGVIFNHYENKPYYVELYRTKLMEQESLRSEFSDDDEQISRSPRGSKKVKLQYITAYLPPPQPPCISGYFSVFSFFSIEEGTKTSVHE